MKLALATPTPEVEVPVPVALLSGTFDERLRKAARLGYAEHPGLSALHREAKELLYTSPCDLATATRAVAGYQHRLAELIGDRSC